MHVEHTVRIPHQRLFNGENRRIIETSNHKHVGNMKRMAKLYIMMLANIPQERESLDEDCIKFIKLQFIMQNGAP